MVFNFFLDNFNQRPYYLYLYFYYQHINNLIHYPLFLAVNNFNNKKYIKYSKFNNNYFYFYFFVLNENLYYT